MVQLLKKYRTCWIAPGAALIILAILFGIYHLFPFAKQTLSWCDMNQQVIPFLLDFKNIVLGESDLFLNMANAGGMSFWGVFLFFISSPFTFLVLLVPTQHIYLFANILVALKMMTCAFTASLFFRSRFPSLDILQNTALSLSYAFCGYTMMYYQNVVWLDVVYVFPLLLLGVDRLIQKGKPAGFIIAFTAVMAVNFYLTYMVVIFLVVGFGIYIWFSTEKGKRGKPILLLGLSTVIVALLSAVFWLPSLKQYLQSARTTGLIESLSSGNFFTQLSTTLPVVFCTAILLTAIPLLSLTERWKDRKVFAVFCVFVLLMIPVFIDPINKMWHTGSYQAFPVRYGYMTVFIGLILFASIFSSCNEQQERRILTKAPQNRIAISFSFFLVAALGTVGCLLLIYCQDTLASYIQTLWFSNKAFGYFMLFASIAAVLYFFLVFFYQRHHLRRTMFSILLCLTVVLEGIFSGGVFIGSASRPTYTYNSILDLEDRIEDDTVYRVKNQKKYFDVNLVGALGYNTLNHYTSLTSKDFMYTMKKLGYSSYWMEVGSQGGTLLSDFLMANKYTILQNSDLTYINSGYTILQNPSISSFGVVFSPDDISQLEKLPDISRMDLQNYLFQTIFSTSQNLVTAYPRVQGTDFSTITHEQAFYSYMDSELIYECRVEGTQTLYFDCFDTISNALVERVNGTANVYVNGKRIETSYPSQRNNGLLELGTFTDETVFVRIELLKDVRAHSFGVYGIDETLLTETIAQQPTVTFKQQGHTLQGTASASQEQSYLFLPLVNQEGFTVQVNGKPVEAQTVFDAFMAIPLEQGENTITVSYIPPGFIWGCILSGIGVVCFILLLFFLRSKWRPKLVVLEKLSAFLFLGLFCFVLLIVYVFPVVVYILF